VLLYCQEDISKDLKTFINYFLAFGRAVNFLILMPIFAIEIAKIDINKK
jgi:hypothetical protein